MQLSNKESLQCEWMMVKNKHLKNQVMIEQKAQKWAKTNKGLPRGLPQWLPWLKGS
jgi:hypothetical protein